MRAFRVPSANPTPPPAAPQVNRPARADAGLARSGELRGQLGPLLRDVEATQSASNRIATADAGLQEIADLLGEIRESSVTAQAPRGADSLRNDSTNAVRIIDQALDQVNSLRGFLGALESDTLQPNSRSLGSVIENLVASESEIRDLDFAAETADFTRSQVLFGQGTTGITSKFLVPQKVLQLLDND